MTGAADRAWPLVLIAVALRPDATEPRPAMWAWLAWMTLAVVPGRPAPQSGSRLSISMALPRTREYTTSAGKLLKSFVATSRVSGHVESECG